MNAPLPQSLRRQLGAMTQPEAAEALDRIADDVEAIRAKTDLTISVDDVMYHVQEKMPAGVGLALNMAMRARDGKLFWALFKDAFDFLSNDALKSEISYLETLRERDMWEENHG